MRKQRINCYELYTYGPDEPIYSRGADYHTGMWIIDVFAPSIKEAYRFLCNQIVHTPETRVGIYFIDNSAGPKKGWPWEKIPITLKPYWWSIPPSQDNRSRP